MYFGFLADNDKLISTKAYLCVGVWVCHIVDTCWDTAVSYNNPVLMDSESEFNLKHFICLRGGELNGLKGCCLHFYGALV